MQQQPQYPAPNYPGPPVPPQQPKKSIGKIVGMGCGGIIALFVLLAACAAVLDPDPSKTSSKSRATATPASGCATASPTAPAGKPIAKNGASVAIAPVVCAPQTSGVNADVALAVTNTTDTPTSYSIRVRVEYQSTLGDKVDTKEDFVPTGTIAPGKTIEKVATARLPFHKPGTSITATIIEVDPFVMDTGTTGGSGGTDTDTDTGGDVDKPKSCSRKWYC
ncbi:hypothetical protein [Streptomyces sp. MS1.AVA.4]|uniref:Uncharacterized protein n=1 Tax=Streptomyces pratisoli TaxID=3139917 RepID=A0ACC6QUW6_9ACTN